MSKKSNKEEIIEEQPTGQQQEAVEDTVETVSEEEQLKSDLQSEKDKFLRLFAEFENYKKRTTRERIELFKTAGEEIMLSMLPVLDDFDRAYLEISKTEEKELLKGVELIRVKLKDTLRQKGLSEVEVKQGDKFNPDDHEAVTQIPAPNKKLKGKIIDIIEKGYKLGDKVIRFPKVVIGQ